MLRGKRLRGTLCLSILLAMPSAGLAQKTKKSGKGHKADTIHVVSRLVNLSVVVRGKNNRPVTNLSRKDFTIYDGRIKQKIAFFRAPSNRPASPAPESEKRNYFSNMSTKGGGYSAGVTVVLLDELNMPFLTQYSARLKVLQFLRQIQPGDHIALYVLGTKLIVIHDFTGSTKTLIAALDQYGYDLRNRASRAVHVSRVPGGGAAVANMVAMLNETIEHSNEVMSAYAQSNQLAITLTALDEIARHMTGVPGRKNLIWLTGSLPFCLCLRDQNLDWQDYDSIRNTERMLSSANVAVYPIDARGLIGTGPNPIPHFAMEQVAQRTGGRAYFDTNGILKSIRSAANDGDYSYRLSYYPNHGDWKGEFRKIEVKVDRPGLKARTRSGYYAFPVRSEPDNSLASVTLNPLDETGIPINVRVTPEGSGGEARVRLAVKFDPQSVRLASTSRGKQMRLGLGFYEENGKGKIIAAHQQAFALSPTQGASKSVGFSVAIPLQQKASALVLALRDLTTGITGSVRIPLEKYQPGKKHSKR